ncbi:amidohydrolase family protein [Hungatella hathewayi]|uniref:amidohydrolase family protein n=1 Tax=Hungatella hathewayi TaxID=154046 RepID=UPI0026DB710B|nr:amidohydrolase family protein [Hungatella hathewayi]
MLPCDILIKNASVLMPDMSIAKNQTIAISGSRILEIADTDNSDQTISCQAETVIDDPHLLWMPGLTDGHLHTSQQFLRGSLLDEKPVIWKRINVPFEASLTEETMALSARLSGAEMIKCGTTSFVDAGGPHIEAAAEEYLKMGMRGALTWQTTDGANVPDGLRIDTREALPRLEKFHREYHGKDGLLKVYYSVTSLMSCTEDLFYTIFLAAKEQNVTAECHMNEYASEVLDFIERYGERPFLYLDRIGALSPQFVAAHCIMLSESEIQIVQDRGIKVVHCPFSNCGKGVPQTPRLLAAGIPVAFGSDGAGHGGLDLFREMRAFRCIMNVAWGITTGNPEIMPARTLLAMALEGGAQALMNSSLGSVRRGNLADLIAIDLDQPHLTPTGSIVNTLIESASGADVKHSIINGKLVMKDRKLLTIDEEKVVSEANQAMKSHALFTKAGAYTG